MLSSNYLNRQHSLESKSSLCMNSTVQSSRQSFAIVENGRVREMTKAEVKFFENLDDISFEDK